MPFDPTAARRNQVYTKSETETLVVSSVYRRATLAQLQAIENPPANASGEVFADGPNTGSYRLEGDTWIKISNATIPALDARMSATEEGLGLSA